MKGSKMITRSDIETFVNRHASFFGGSVTDATSAEACFIFGSGFDNELDNDTRLWLQTYIPSSDIERSRLFQARVSASQSCGRIDIENIA